MSAATTERNTQDPGAVRPSAVRDVLAVWNRQARPLVRNPLAVVFGMAQPLLYLALFAPLLTGLGGPEGQDPWQWFVPGLLVMLALFTCGFAGFGLLPEIASGAHERMLATPASRTSLLLGRVVQDVALMLVQSVLVLLLVLPLGFRAPLPETVLGLALLAVLGAVLATLSYVVALATRQTYVFAPVLQTVVMPLMLLSGVLLPMDLAPGWLYTLSRLNPLAHVVDAERALFAGQWGTDVAVGWVVALVLLVLSLVLGARMMRRGAS
ncbi:ABC transporter permease [Nocardiopsis sp. HNM0947]|uniref:Transport permease protein n=1 Tax=Nocardiopsis coralli TaxID=2772213 RepID=A0ABR9PEN1_9ACTN|nr:ABC transporter permease [Nocardiopsis coralli]MBE3002286.1 ABC transporter permease [Nocardiopsis coralli]